jgi:hypothetical protein
VKAAEVADAFDSASSDLDCHVVGGALVVQRKDAQRPVPESFATSLAADRARAVVVVGATGDYRAEDWAPVVRHLRRKPGPVVLVAGSPDAGSTVGVGRRLADELGRTVLAQDGTAVPASRGGLFVPPEAGPGWVTLNPGQRPVPCSRRFPAPSRTSDALEDRWTAADDVVVDPLPGGVWLHPAWDDDDKLRHLQSGLVSWLWWSQDQILVVVGHPGGRAVSMSAVASFWRFLPREDRASARFVFFGALGTTGDEPAGQVLADYLSDTVRVVQGMPWAGPAAADQGWLQTVRDDGSPGWHPFATELSYRPREAGGELMPEPRVTGHQSPFAGLLEVSPGVYDYRDGTVLQVVPCGLWLRAKDGATDAGPILRRQCVPERPEIVFDAESPNASQLRDLALTVRDQLVPQAGGPCEVIGLMKPPGAPEPPVEPGAASSLPRAAAQGLPDIRLVSGLSDAAGSLAPPAELISAAAPDVSGGDPEPGPGDAREAGLTGPVDKRTRPPGEPVPEAAAPAPDSRVPGARLKLQPLPAPEASVIPPARGIERERSWLRRNLTLQYDATASLVSRVLAENPGIRGTGGGSPELLTDLVALKLYLSAHAARLNSAVRAGKTGSHVPFGRCVAAGLARMPAHRGPTRLRATLADDELQWYKERLLVSEWGFCAALAGGQARLPGDTGVFIWSMTGRRTSLIDPAVPDQVVFLPGTTFKVLSAADEGRRDVFLRELASSEVDADGRVAAGVTPLDKTALGSLERAAQIWGQAPVQELPPGYDNRFDTPPGLLLKAGLPADAVAPDAAEVVLQ